MLAESPPPEMNQPNSYRRQAIEEILLSEKSYMAHLELLIKYFITPIREKKLMDDSAQSAIFGQIELIHNLSKELLKELDTSLDMVAEAFLKLAPFFKLYSVYAFDYKNSLFLLQVKFSSSSIYLEITFNNYFRNCILRTNSSKYSLITLSVDLRYK